MSTWCGTRASSAAVHVLPGRLLGHGGRHLARPAAPCADLRSARQGRYEFEQRAAQSAALEDSGASQARSATHLQKARVLGGAAGPPRPQPHPPDDAPPVQAPACAQPLLAQRLLLTCAGPLLCSALLSASVPLLSACSAQCLHAVSGGAPVPCPTQRLAERAALEALQAAVTVAGAPAQEQSPPPSPFTRLTGHASRGSLAGARDGSDGSDGWEEVRAAGSDPGAARAGVLPPGLPQSAAWLQAAPRAALRRSDSGGRRCRVSAAVRGPACRQGFCGHPPPEARMHLAARRRCPAYAPRSGGRWGPGAARALPRGAPMTAARRPAPGRCRAARCARARSTGPPAPRRTAAAHKRPYPARARP